ncbi:MAG: inner membrane protein YpjD [bacterium]
MEHLITNLIVVLVLTATVSSLIFLFNRVRKFSRISLWLTGGAISLNILYYLYGIFQNRLIPFSGPADSFLFFAWSIMVIYLAVELKYKTGVFGSFILPLALFSSIYALISPREVDHLLSGSKGAVLVIHASCAFLGFAAFAFTGGVAIMYLIQERQLKSKHTSGLLFHRLPALDTLDKLGYHLLLVGFPLLTVSVLSGILWSGTSRASYFQLQPKEVWFLIIWILYGILLQARAAVGWGGKKAAYLAISSFLLACLPLFIIS